MAQQVMDPALSVLWYRFDPWSGNCHMLQVWPKTNKEKKDDDRRVERNDIYNVKFFSNYLPVSMRVSYNKY